MFNYEEYVAKNKMNKGNSSLTLSTLPHIDRVIVNGDYPHMDVAELSIGSSKRNITVVALISVTLNGQDAVSNPSALKNWRGWGK